MNCVPLISDSPSFATQPHRRRARRRPSASRAVEELAVDARLALADERQREMRERREVAGRADRAARRARTAARRGSGTRAAARPSRTRAPELPLASAFARRSIAARTTASGIRHADAARVRAEQPQLQLLGLLLGDLLRDEPAEAGIHAVGVLVAPCATRWTTCPRRVHPLARARRRARPARRSTATSQTSVE